MTQPAKLSAVSRALFARDIRLMVRRWSDLIQPVVFYLFIIILFSLGTGADPGQLKTIGAAVLWVAALLSTLLGLESLFRSEFDDGSLEQLALSPHPLALLLLTRVATHWIATGLPLLLVTPLLAELLYLDASAIKTVLVSLLIGTPTLSLIGSVGVALTVGLRRGGLLSALIVLPLYIPVLIIGPGAIQVTMAGLSPASELYALGAMLTLAITLAPLATGAALRISLNS